MLISFKYLLNIYISRSAAFFVLQNTNHLEALKINKPKCIICHNSIGRVDFLTEKINEIKCQL